MRALKAVDLPALTSERAGSIPEPIERKIPMPVKFAIKVIKIRSQKGLLITDGSAKFGSNVISAGIAVSSFKLFYDRLDHHILVLQVEPVKTRIFRNTVFFEITCHFADKSVNDPYSGEVRLLIIAEVEPVPTILQKRTRRSSSPNPKRKSLTSRKSLTGGRRRSHKVARKRTSR